MSQEGHSASAAGRTGTSGTGDPRVDDAVARLDECGELPLEESVAVFNDVHRRLSEVLADSAGQG
jgi:hypothetical protein